MNPVVVVLAGGGCGIGSLLIVLGLRGVPQRPDRPASRQLAGVGLGALVERRLRIGFALGGAGAMWLIAGWPVATLLAAAAGFVAPTLAGVRVRREASIATTEAVAGWVEQLRDTIGAAAGIQGAITASANLAPLPIRPAVQDLAAASRRGPLRDGLHRFAQDVDDPTADQVAVALILASERRGQDLVKLLSDLANAARDDAAMRLRIETSRAQTYNDAKVVSLIVLAVFGFMLLFNRSYLDAFGTWTGQAVLGVIGCLWALALWALVELSEVRRPPRVLTGLPDDGHGDGGQR